MNWDEHFVYDPSIPEGLRWNRFAANRRIKPNDPAGKFAHKKHNSNKGYFRTYVINRSYANHRIIWEMFNRKLEDGEQVDHIDGNTKNNRIENLRVVDSKTNCYNQKKRVNNKSGVTGVHLIDNGDGLYYWVASWMQDGRYKKKLFPVKKYRDEVAFNLAVKTREQEINELKLTGINITERHGK